MILEAVTNLPITETISNHSLFAFRREKKIIIIYFCNIIYTCNNAHFETVVIQDEKYR